MRRVCDRWRQADKNMNKADSSLTPSSRSSGGVSRNDKLVGGCRTQLKQRFSNRADVETKRLGFYNLGINNRADSSCSPNDVGNVRSPSAGTVTESYADAGEGADGIRGTGPTTFILGRDHGR